MCFGIFKFRHYLRTRLLVSIGSCHHNMTTGFQISQHVEITAMYLQNSVDQVFVSVVNLLCQITCSNCSTLDLRTSSQYFQWASAFKVPLAVSEGSIHRNQSILELPEVLPTMEEYYLFTFYVLMGALWVFAHLTPFPVRQYLKLFSEAMVLNVTFVVCLPAIIIFNSVITITRLCLRYYLSVCEPDVTLMNSSDAVWSLEGYAESCNINCLYVLKGVADLSKIQERFKLLATHPDYSRMRHTVVNRWGFKCFQQRDSIHIQDHVKYMKLQKRGSSARTTDTQVFEMMTEFADETFKMDRPPWELLVVPNFVYSEEPASQGTQCYALVFRIHHSIMDGITAGLAIRNVIADSPPLMSFDPCQKARVPWSIRLAAYAMVTLVGIHQVFKGTTTRHRNCFHSGKRLQGPKKFAWSRKVQLGELKAIREGTNTSTTSVLLSSMGLALKQVAEQCKVDPPEKVILGPTVAILPYPNTRPQNRFMLARIPVNLKCQSRYQTLTECHRSMRELSRYSELLMNKALVWLTGRWPETVIHVFMSVIHGTMLLSNVPGFKETVYMFGGDELVDAVGWPPIKGSTGIGTCLFSYNGSVRAAVVADSVSSPSNSTAKHLTKAFEHQIEAFARDLEMQKNNIKKSA